MVTSAPVRPRVRVILAMTPTLSGSLAALLVALLVAFEGARVGRDVDRVLAQRGQRDDLQRALVRARQDDRRRAAILVGAKPVHGRHAPAVPRYQPGEAELRHGSGEVVADTPLVLEELARHDRADGVTPPVLGSGRACAVTVEPSQRVTPTGLKLSAQHVPVAHPSSIGRGAAGPQPPEDDLDNALAESSPAAVRPTSASAFAGRSGTHGLNPIWPMLELRSHETNSRHSPRMYSIRG